MAAEAVALAAAMAEALAVAATVVRATAVAVSVTVAMAVSVMVAMLVMATMAVAMVVAVAVCIVAVPFEIIFVSQPNGREKALCIIEHASAAAKEIYVIYSTAKCMLLFTHLQMISSIVLQEHCHVHVDEHNL